MFGLLRIEFPIHPLEKEFDAPAEVILEAISRSPDLTRRGVRGIIAEAWFETRVLPRLQEWTSKETGGDKAYDFLIENGLRSVRIQVKMQRLKKHVPMRAREANKLFSDDKYVVETQKTRGGIDTEGKDTRPYRFGEFDLLAVSLHPSTRNWDDFMYIAANWLVPDPHDSDNIFKYQPVPMEEDDFWTRDLNRCIETLHNQGMRRIFELPATYSAKTRRRKSVNVGEKPNHPRKGTQPLFRGTD